MEIPSDSADSPWYSMGFLGDFVVFHEVSMENFACLFPRGNPMGYETETAIVQDRLVCSLQSAAAPL